MKRSRLSGFTLVEILIVVVIMGILASIVIPQFAQSSDDARYSATIQNLQTLRSQIDLYRNQHENRYPGIVGAAVDLTVFEKQMVFPTDEAGNTAGTPDDGFKDRVKYPFGPYVTNKLPNNPFSGSRTVLTVENGAFGTLATDPKSTDPGWIYDVTSGRIKINKDGTTPDQQNYKDL